MRERSDRRVDGGDWDDAVRGFLLRAWDFEFLLFCLLLCSLCF